MKTEPNKGQYSIYMLTYHLVLAVKYRYKAITEQIANHFETMFKEQIKKNGGELLAISYETDHIHILFSAPPQLRPSSFINAYKSSTSRIVKTKCPKICKQLWKEHFWSRSYCLLTTGGTPIAIIKQYISNQQGE